MLPPPCRLIAALGIAFLPAMPASADDDPFADAIVEYVPGSNAVPGYTDPAVSLGAPARFTGVPMDPMIVSVLNGPWRPAEIVSIGAGGRLVLQFDTPVTDDPFNPFGIDLLIFGNAFFAAGPGGDSCANPAFCFSEGGVVEVSTDGEAWVEAVGVDGDGMFPTEGYLDRVDPYDTAPGLIESDFTRPVGPSLQLADFGGLHYTDVLDLYRGSGGGAGIDLAPLGLAAISYVRITNPAGAFDTPEIDAVADVAPRWPGDADGDGIVNVADLLAVLAAWGPARPAGWDADFNGDGEVNVLDLLTVLAHWG